MKVEAVNAHENAMIKLYDRRGRTNKAAVRTLYRVMRCHQTRTQRRIHWRLVSALYRISRAFPGKTIQIYSGYRSRKVASLDSSYHIKGMAADISIPGVSKQRLRDYLRRTFKRSGVGYYPNTPFVHFDVRQKAAFWVDLSGRGENARYAPNAYTYLKGERTKKDKKTDQTISGPVTASAKPAQAENEPAAPGGPITGTGPGQAAAATVPAISEAVRAFETAASGGPLAGTPAPAASAKSEPTVVQGPPPLGPTPPGGAAAKKPASPRKPSKPARASAAGKGAPATSKDSRPEQKLTNQPPVSPGPSVDHEAAAEEEAKVRRGPVSKIRSAP